MDHRTYSSLYMPQVGRSRLGLVSLAGSPRDPGLSGPTLRSGYAD